jgi:hypothetical protein
MLSFGISAMLASLAGIIGPLGSFDLAGLHLHAPRFAAAVLGGRERQEHRARHLIGLTEGLRRPDAPLLFDKLRLDPAAAVPLDPAVCASADRDSDQAQGLFSRAGSNLSRRQDPEGLRW